MDLGVVQTLAANLIGTLMYGRERQMKHKQHLFLVAVTIVAGLISDVVAQEAQKADVIETSTEVVAQETQKADVVETSTKRAKFFNQSFYQSLVSGIVGSLIGVSVGFWAALRADRWTVRRFQKKNRSVLTRNLQILRSNIDILYCEFQRVKEDPDQQITSWSPSSNIDTAIIARIRSISLDDVEGSILFDILTGLAKKLVDLKETIDKQKEYILQTNKQKVNTLQSRKKMAEQFESTFLLIISDIVFLIESLS